jgi:7,8-dihydropterin-6-yl-methyl-4-(beta-D-ribofuranosyl)aminobenzene 5'-phosphate synthase
MSDVGPARRVKPVELATAVASQFVDGVTAPVLVAEHGFSALVRVRRGSRVHTLWFDTGVSPDGLAINVERMGIDVSEIEALVLSHGHFDHCGGLAGLSSLGGREGLPLTVHPLVWTRRRLVPPGQPSWELPTLSRQSLEAEGFAVIERRQPSLLLDGSVLITGEVDRTTDFERGLPFHEAARTFVGTGPVDHRRSSPRRSHPWPRTRRAHRMRSRWGGETSRDMRCG